MASLYNNYLKSKYIGTISLVSLRNYILDNKLSENDTIVLHQEDMDALALEYRETYTIQLPEPFIWVGVLIREQDDEDIAKQRILIIENDTESIRSIEDVRSDYPPSYEVIYRCGWCGNVVDSDGQEFDPQIRQYKISILEKFKNEIPVKQVSGKCCHDKN